MTKHVTRMTIYDAEHYTDAEREAIIASYPEYERDARAKGVPQLGSGRVYPVSEDQIKIDAMEIPPYWPVLAALDFGWDHPTAAVKIAWDRDGDVVYVTREYRERQKPAIYHAGALKGWGSKLFWVWPHDGLQHDKQSGKTLASVYSEHGLQMAPDKVTHPDGGTGVEAGIMEILDRMETGRFKVFAGLSEWFNEFRLYHREEGLIVDEYDDLMDATRYAVMGLRFARTMQETRPRRPQPGGWMSA